MALFMCGKLSRDWSQGPNLSDPITFCYLRGITCVVCYSGAGRLGTLKYNSFRWRSILWSPRYIKDKKLMKRVQRRATKLIPDLKELPYETRLKKLQLPIKFKRYYQ